MSERLPENGHYYLWCSDMGSVQSDYYWDGFEKEQKYGYNIVAWMPLPRPYTADRKTESNSEKPNNCEDAKNPSGDVWECGCFLDTYCEHQIYDRNPDGTINIVECGYEPKDERQTERSNNADHIE